MMTDDAATRDYAHNHPGPVFAVIESFSKAAAGELSMDQTRLTNSDDDALFEAYDCLVVMLKLMIDDHQFGDDHPISQLWRGVDGLVRLCRRQRELVGLERLMHEEEDR
jgi:hypothetical protein